MGETIYNFRRERARPVCIFGFDVKTARNYQSFVGCGGESIVSAKLDFQQLISNVRRTDQRLADVRGLLYFSVAVFDVAALSEAYFY